MKKTKSSGTDRIVIGGLHRNDFKWASSQCEEAGLVFCGFMLDVDGFPLEGNLRQSRPT